MTPDEAGVAVADTTGTISEALMIGAAGRGVGIGAGVGADAGAGNTVVADEFSFFLVKKPTYPVPEERPAGMRMSGLYFSWNLTTAWAVLIPK